MKPTAGPLITCEAVADAMNVLKPTTLKARAEALEQKDNLIADHTMTTPTTAPAAPQFSDPVRRAFAELAEQPAEPVAWRDHVEHRLRTWRQKTMNRSGDRLALDDFMDADSLEDLVDFVCDEWAEPAPHPAPSAPAVPEDRRMAVWRVMQLADAMARRHAERDIPTGDLYRSIAQDAWVKAHQALHEAVEQLAAAPHPAAKGGAE